MSPGKYLWRDGAVDDFAQRECRFDPGHARQLGDFLAMDAFIILDGFCNHGHKIIVATGHQEAAQHRRAGSGGCLEYGERLIALAVEADRDDYGGRIAEVAEIDVGPVARNDAIFLKRLLSPRAGWSKWH